jgi:hypothetical protein
LFKGGNIGMGLFTILGATGAGGILLVGRGGGGILLVGRGGGVILLVGRGGGRGILLVGRGGGGGIFDLPGRGGAAGVLLAPGRGGVVGILEPGGVALYSSSVVNIFGLASEFSAKSAVSSRCSSSSTYKLP